MPRAKRRDDGLDAAQAAELLAHEWQTVRRLAEETPGLRFVSDERLRAKIHGSINHAQVSYRFCLPIQLLGKLTNPQLDALRLQKRPGDPTDKTGWDARSFGRHVFAPFNRNQECPLGTSGDPYVGNPMRIPRMVRGDPSKRDIEGWNDLVDVLEKIEQTNDPSFTALAFREVLLEILKLQRAQRFSYPVPPRISLEAACLLVASFLGERSGGDRALAVTAALFHVVGERFGLFSAVARSAINAADASTGLAADLECIDAEGKVALAVEVKDRKLALADLEGTIQKARERNIRDVFFATTGVSQREAGAVAQRVSSAFAAGQNLYVFELADLLRSVLAFSGEEGRTMFLKKIGEHLDLWNTQPVHRQAWKTLLQAA